MGNKKGKGGTGRIAVIDLTESEEGKAGKNDPESVVEQVKGGGKQKESRKSGHKPSTSGSEAQG